MKEYNRTTKKYEEATDIKIKKRKSCKGGREHDWVMVLPFWFEAVDGVYNGNPEPAYTYRQRLEELEERLKNELADLGIVSKYRWGSVGRNIREDYRTYQCSVCHKSTSCKVNEIP